MAAKGPKTLSSDDKARLIEEYETFIDQKLKADLKRILDAREKIYERIAEYLKLRNNILMLQEQDLKELKTMINLGSEFYVQAKVPDCSKLFINIGLGFHLEMNHSEALNFITQREKELQSQAEELSKKAAYVKARIKIMVAGIGQLMDLPDTTPSQNRTVH